MTHRTGRLRRAGVAAVAALTGLAGTALTAGPARADADFAFTRLFGADRYGTAAAIATGSFPEGADTVILATGETFPDALVGNYLAGVEGAPILLTTRDALPEVTADAIEDLGAARVVILGGVAAVSETVEDQVDAMPAGGGTIEVERVYGADRYATAAAIANEAGVDAVGNVNGDRSAIVATGEQFPDALAGGPVSYAAGLPTILTQATTLTPTAADALDGLGIENVVLLGGTAAVSQQVEDDIKAMGIDVTRLAGADRAETATKIADFGMDDVFDGGPLFDATHVNLARGDRFPDALTGGPHGGEDTAPILLALSPDVLGTSSCTWLEDNAPTLQTGHIFGGVAAVSGAVENEAEGCAGAPAAIDVSPQTATAAFATPEDPNSPQFTVTVTNSAGDPVTLANDDVRYRVYRQAAGSSASCTTTPGGDPVAAGGSTASGSTATFTYTGPQDPSAGSGDTIRDCVVVFYDANGNGTLDAGELVTVATVTYTDETGPATLDLTSADTTLAYGDTTAITGTVEDQTGTAVSGAAIRWEVYRNGSTSAAEVGTATTDTSGAFTIAYTGPNADANDRVVACVDDPATTGCDVEFGSGGTIVSVGDTPADTILIRWRDLTSAAAVD